MAEDIPLLPRTKPQNRRKRVAPASPKLGTFDGVYLLTSLNVLSILMFLRFGFIVGQMGIMGSVLLLVMSYLINVLTVLSISAISTNGTVKGGGAYYMISRSLGPEFGGAIGLIFFVGQILNASLNVVGFIEPLLVNFGAVQGDILPLLPVSRVWELAYSTLLLAMCTGVAIVGLSLVSKTALWLFVLLTLSTLSIPVSALVVPAGHPLPAPWDGLKYTGISWATTLENLWPQFTSGAVGSVQPPGVPETFRNMFGIFFPATAGIFAGSSMSGDLKTPSRLIPKGTLYGLLTSFVLYLLVIVSLGVSTPRELLHRDIKVIQSINMNGLIIIIGEVSTSLFSVIMGVVGAASMLNAIADDRIIPGLSAFATRKKRPHEKRRAELLSILLTWLLAQVFLFADINQIAIFITMAFLMTFLVTNLACFLLRLGSAPNFRPSFKYFNSKTAFTGGLTSVIAMYICDGVSATSAIVFLVFLIMMIHYSTPPLNFGDILQLLIYHQVRKYLLRLKLQMSVKYWRPQILLLCDDPQTSWNLIGFCNHLKKGGLYILGHVVLLDDHSSSDGVSSEFNISSFKEIRKQKNAWLKLRDLAKIKAFVQIAIGPSLPWGVRNVFLGSGLGGMKPNITVIGFYDFHKHGVELPMKQSHLQLPTDDCRKEKKVSVNQWVQIVEDLVIMQATVAVAANFRDMKLPIFEKLWIKSKMSKMGKKPKKYIDLYPIQMSTICLLEDGKSVMSTNFDTYTLILQLGLILSTVDEWEKNGYVLRIIAFVETTAEQEDERQRLGTLLESLRIDAEVKIVCFDSENLPSYNLLVKGHDVTTDTRAVYEHIELILNTDQWWINMVEGRKALRDLEAQKRPRKGNHKSRAIVIADDLSNRLRKLTFTSKSPSEGTGRGKSLKNNRRYTLSNLHEQGLSLSLNMKAQGDGLFFKYDGVLDSSDDSDTEKDYIKEDVASHASSVLNQQGIVRPQSSGYASTTATQKSSPSPKLEVQQTRPATSSQARTPVSGLDVRRAKMLLPKTPDQLSIRASRSNLRPNFLAGKIPHSKIRDDADDAEADEDSENAKPSIEFVEEAEHSEEEDDGDDIEDDHQMHLDTGPEKVKDAENIYKDGPLTSSLTHSLTETNRAGLKATSRRAIQGKKGQSVHFNPQFEQAGTQTPSILTNDGIHEHLQSPGFREDDEGLSLSSREMSTVNLREGTSGLSRENKLTYRLLQKELELLSFSDLPAKGQHIILNELMKKISKTDDTAVIFSTLPAPAIGSHLDDEESLAYTNSLAIWLDGLAPVLLLNSQTVTVTTSL